MSATHPRGIPSDRPGSQRDWWPGAFFLAHLVHACAFAHFYPNNRYDTDLLAYFVYFRNWLKHDTTLHGVAYFMLPKPLLVFTLGPLADVSLAFYCSAIASAVLGALVYLVGRTFLGRATGLLFAGCLLLDPQKAELTLKSSADLYIAALLFAAVYLSTLRRAGAASICLLLSALVKPVTLPCGAYFLASDERSRRAWLWAALPLLAVPLTLLANAALLGSAFGSNEFLNEFVTLRKGSTIGPGEVLHFAVWTQLVKNRFVSTATWGFVGIVLWLAADRKRLTSPLLLMPLLFVIGYVLLSVLGPYMPFYRFYWPLEIWFLGFLLFGVWETARRLGEAHTWVRTVLTCLLLFFLVDDYVVRQFTYRDQSALPFEAGMSFVKSAEEVIAKQRTDGERLLTPLAFLPFLLWEGEGRGRADLIVAAEREALNPQPTPPEWVLDVPKIYASDGARDLVNRLVREGAYEVRLTDGKAALLKLRMPPHQ